MAYPLPALRPLQQVGVSIQSQILVPNPIVNEPGYDSREGSAQSKEYNAKLRLDTMRHGMLAQLRSPPVGFESAVAAHFAQQRDRVLRQCWQWTLEAPLELREKMMATLTQLHAALPAVSPSAAPAPAIGGSAADGAEDDASIQGDASAASSAQGAANGVVPAFPVAKADVGSASDDELYY